jgi:hypothetical protein
MTEAFPPMEVPPIAALVAEDLFEAMKDMRITSADSSLRLQAHGPILDTKTGDPAGDDTCEANFDLAVNGRSFTCTLTDNRTEDLDVEKEQA